MWRQARTEPEVATAAGVRIGYKNLFQTFPDADRKDSESLTNFFKARTDVGDAAIKMMVATFKALAQYGDFNSSESKADTTDKLSIPPQSTNIANPPSNSSIPSSNSMSVNLNIELALPADESGKVYDAFFKSMKKHLIDATSDTD